MIGFDAAEAERAAKQRIELVGCAAQDVGELARAGAGGDPGAWYSHHQSRSVMRELRSTRADSIRPVIRVRRDIRRLFGP